jgi:hypothetical protein
MHGTPADLCLHICKNIDEIQQEKELPTAEKKCPFSFTQRSRETKRLAQLKEIHLPPTGSNETGNHNMLVTLALLTVESGPGAFAERTTWRLHKVEQPASRGVRRSFERLRYGARQTQLPQR